ncbi:unnamed protein product [Caenorhabditis sp. 36 PRJEB53466]|nr:unnamed protein product [Caenorhabditis sp. 36 PRJEB53466]
MGPLEILNLSSCSKRTAEVLCHISKRNFALFSSVNLSKSRISVTLFFEGKRPDLQLNFANHDLCLLTHVQETKSIGGKVFKTCHVKNAKHEITFNGRDFVGGFVIVIQHLLELFHVPLKLVIEANVKYLETILAVKKLQYCWDLVLARSAHGWSYFDCDMLELISEKITVTHNFAVKTSMSAVHMKQLFTARNISLVDANWLNRSELTHMALNCHTVKVTGRPVSCHDIEKAVYYWFRHPKTPHLRRLEFPVEYRHFCGFAPSKVPTKNWDPKMRSKHCFKYENWPRGGYYDCSTAHDFIRADGLLASAVLISEEHVEPTVVIHVWHDRWPTAPVIEKNREKLKELYKQLPLINQQFGASLEIEEELMNPELDDHAFKTYLHTAITLRNSTRYRKDKIDDWLAFHQEILRIRGKITKLL